MRLFHREKPLEYDHDRYEPAVRRSICTGEMTLGFIDRETGQFRDHGKAADQEELEEFCRKTGVTTERIRTIY